MPPYLRLSLLLVLGTLLQACVSTKPPSSAMDSTSAMRHQAHLKHIASIQTFTLKGRIGVQTHSKGFSGGLLWQHAVSHDNIALYSPLGSQVASIAKNNEKITLEDANGNTLSAESAETLTQSALGWVLPLAGLADWSLGKPSSASIGVSVWDAHGHLSTLKQDGWEIEYQHYAMQDGYMLPHKIFLKSEKVNLKLLVEKWEINSAEQIDTQHTI